MNPVEEFLGVSNSEDDGVEKEASWLGDLARSFGQGMALRPLGANNSAVAHAAGSVLTTGAIASGIGGLAHGIHKGVSGMVDKYQKPRQYRDMIAAHPSLQEADSGTTQAYFNALHAMAPGVAAEPLLAGSFVRNMMSRNIESGAAIPMETAKMMSEISKNLGQSESKIPSYLLPLTQGRVPFPEHQKPAPPAPPVGFEETRTRVDPRSGDEYTERVKRENIYGK